MTGLGLSLRAEGYGPGIRARDTGPGYGPGRNRAGPLCLKQSRTPLFRPSSVPYWSRGPDACCEEADQAPSDAAKRSKAARARYSKTPTVETLQRRAPSKALPFTPPLLCHGAAAAQPLATGGSPRDGSSNHSPQPIMAPQTTALSPSWLFKSRNSL